MFTQKLLNNFTTTVIAKRRGTFKFTSKTLKEMNIFLSNMIEALLIMIRDGECEPDTPTDLTLTIMSLITTHNISQNTIDERWVKKVKLIKKKAKLKFNLSSDNAASLAKFILNTMEIIVVMFVNIIPSFNKKRITEKMFWSVINIIIPKKHISFMNTRQKKPKTRRATSKRATGRRQTSKRRT